MIDSFVHIVHSTRSASEGEPDFAVMFAPVGPAGSGGAMKPHYVKGWEHLVRFLRDIGFTEEAVRGIESDLKKQPSVSVRMSLARPVANTNFYRLRFRPDWVDAGKQSWPKVTVIGGLSRQTLSGGRLRFIMSINAWMWSHSALDPHRPQLAAMRRSFWKAS